MNKNQQAKIKDFKNIVGDQVPNHVCLEFLKKCKWDTNQAVESFFTSGQSDKYGSYQGAANINEQNCKALFANYANESQTKIEGEGIEQFFIDLKVDMEDPVTVAVSKLMDAKSAEWTYDNFKKGCGTAGADTLAGWIQAIPKYQQKLKNDPAFFESVYEQAFEISQEPGLKNIDRDTACALWPIFLEGRCKFLEQWIAFIESTDDYKIIKKDQWNMLFTLIKQTNGDFNKFAEIDDGTWPIIFDEFQEYTSKQ